MHEFKKTDFDELLANFVEPRPKRQREQDPSKPKQDGKIAPYIAFAHYLRERGGIHGAGVVKIVPHIFVLDMSAAHAQLAQLNYYVMQKRFRPVKWHLPVDHVTMDGRTPYRELNEYCEMYSRAGSVSDMLKLAEGSQQQLGSMEQTIAEQAKRIAELEAKEAGENVKGEAKGVRRGSKAEESGS